MLSRLIRYSPSPAVKLPIHTLIMIHNKLLVASCFPRTTQLCPSPEVLYAKSLHEVLQSSGLFSSTKCEVGGGQDRLCTSAEGVVVAIAEAAELWDGEEREEPWCTKDVPSLSAWWR